MLRRFCLYGFLKNQQYYDYFLLLAFLRMGLSYFIIGSLIAFREIMINIIEIPTGGVADLCGRRRSMIFSFSAYILSFTIFGFSGRFTAENEIPRLILVPVLLCAMFFFAVGEAFRTGTHKALIFTWLRNQGRVHERTKVYGYTRSWSKIGSAVSVLIACGIVFATSNFTVVFFFAIIPYLINIVNFLGYPKEIDCEMHPELSLKVIYRHLIQTLVDSVKQPGLRRLILESMGYEGFFKASKDYLQPILMAAAIPLIAALFSQTWLSDEQKSVVLIGPVYFILFILSAVASRNVYRIAHSEGEDGVAHAMWGGNVCIFSILLPAMVFQIHWVMIFGFVLLYVAQNLWRPLLISRFDAHSDETAGATILSIESQAKSLSTMLMAPLLGFFIDLVQAHGMGCNFWPIGMLGLLISLTFFLTGKREIGK